MTRKNLVFNLYINMLVRTYVRLSQFKGQLVMRMHVICGNMQIQSKEGRIEPQSGSIHPSTRVSSYGLDSTMNLDALIASPTLQRGEGKKEKYSSKVNSCTKPSQAGKDRNKSETAVSLGQQRMQGCS